MRSATREVDVAGEAVKFRRSFNVVSVDGSIEGDPIVLEYLTAEDVVDSHHDAAVAALERRGLRVELRGEV